MQNILAIITNMLIFAGACLLGVSLFPIRRLVSQLPEGGSLRRKWNILSALILLFIFGYISYIIVYWDRSNEDINLVVPVVFFFGAVFVLLVGTLALQTALDIKQISTLKYETITDPLMGVHNRRYLDLRLTEEIERAHRYNFQLSMLLLDIDHFKDVNDTYGHYIGDLVLKSLGNLLLKNVRKTDIVARYGGEEIAVIAPHTSVHTAADLAERLRQTVETSIMVPADEQEDRQTVTVSVSIGVAGLDRQIVDKQSLIERTDEALYKAKQKGRNRVIVFNGKGDSL
jgi:diguanylate cyclase (GGDEF)-like protein